MQISWHSTYKNWQRLLMIPLSVLVGLLLGQLIALGCVACLPQGTHNLSHMYASWDTVNDETRLASMLFQSITMVMGFGIVPYLYFKWLEKQSLSVFFPKRPRPHYQWLLGCTVTLTLSAIVLNSWVVLGNENLPFPAFLQPFEQWAQQKEKLVHQQIKVLISTSSPSLFVLLFVTLSIIPACLEEFLFRGILQNFFQHLFKKSALTIWLGATIFSGVHLQFYGFFPRLVLGALFGYMYHWSKDLRFCILAHFINNCLALAIILWDRPEFLASPMPKSVMPPIYLMVIAVPIFIFSLRFFYRNNLL